MGHASRRDHKVRRLLTALALTPVTRVERPSLVGLARHRHLETEPATTDAETTYDRPDRVPFQY
jgi:hypothetical protein